MTTVFLVDGFLFKGAMPQLSIVKNYAAQGCKIVQLDYNNVDATTTNIAATARKCRDTALTTDGKVVFVGVSMGAQVLCNLLRLLPSDSRKLGDWEFNLLCNPEHNITGRIKTPQYGGLGVPAYTPYVVKDVACKGDYYADAPNVSGFAGMMAGLWSLAMGGGIHTFSYMNIDPSLPYPKVQRGNIQDMWVPGNPFGYGMVAGGWNRPVQL